jgi:uncharacterized protein YegP (UPF0339 family)
MITSAADDRIKGVRVTDDELVIALTNGRTLSVPLVWYPRLLNASVEQRRDWRLIGDGEGVHWPQIDEDLSAVGLLRGVPAPASETTGEVVQSVQRTVDKSNLTLGKFQIYQDRKGEYRWRLRARNGEIIADSNEGYGSKASCEHGIDLVKEQSASAEVEDQTEGQAAQADRTEEEGLLDKAKRRLQE